MLSYCWLLHIAQSPFRQRAFAGALKGYLYHGYLRAAGHFPYIAIPFGIGALLIAQSVRAHVLKLALHCPLNSPTCCPCLCVKDTLYTPGERATMHGNLAKLAIWH